MQILEEIETKGNHMALVFSDMTDWLFNVANEAFENKRPIDAPGR